MSELTLDFNWVDQSDKERPELNATFATLLIQVGDDVVTQVHHKPSQTTRKEVVVPLYCLAEWLVGNWWSLLYEAEVPGRSGFLRRHSAASSPYGYCYPDLRIVSEGSHTRLEWCPYNYHFAGLQFTAGGMHRLPIESVSQVLSDFIEAVDQRLKGMGITGSWMQTEWEVLQHTLGVADEESFCRAAAWLGLDPYELSDERSAQLIDVASTIPLTLREDALRAINPEELQVLTGWLRTAQSRMPHRLTTADLHRLRASVRSKDFQLRPWEVGYALAEQARSSLGLTEKEAASIEDICGGQLPVALVPRSPSNIDGLAQLDGVPLCVTSKSRPESQRFLVARALGYYLRSDCEWALFTTARTEAQQVSRAFAAELLAPARAIKQEVPERGYLLQDDVLDLAARFKVSTHVIEYQIRNHQLANLATSD